MHGTAASFAVAGRFSHKLGHGPIEGSALGDTVSVSPVCAGYVVLIRQSGAYSSRYGFFAYIKMYGTAQLVGFK